MMVRAARRNRNEGYYGLSLITSGIPGLQVHKKEIEENQRRL